MMTQRDSAPQRRRRSFNPSALLTAALVASTGFAGGCNLFNREEAKPLTADAFVSQRVEGRADPAPIDRPGQVIVGGVKPPAGEEGADPVAPSSTDTGNPNTISPAVKQATRAPGDTVPATRPAASPGPAPRTTAAPSPRASLKPSTNPTDPSGQYVLFGTVLARVNDRPIYAHKVLSLLDNALRAEAQRYDEEQFRTVAADLINRQVDTQIREEVVFAIAQKALDSREQEIAKMLAAQWQKEQETKAGGSFELAKRKWAEDGWDFSERLDHQYRASMTQVYLQRRVLPLVVVTAADVRKYYEANKATEFTRPGQAKIRYVKIDPRALKLAGGRTEARSIADDLRAKAAANPAGFDTLAQSESNDPTLRASGGLLTAGSEDGYQVKGTYVAEPVEEAAWALQPGGVTDVIEFKNAFYFAKLEDRRDAIALEFEDLVVQERIRDKLKGLQLMEFQRQRQDEFQRDNIYVKNPQMMQLALDMAMQRYPAWREGAPATPTPLPQ